MLLSSLLSEVPLWTGPHEDRLEQGKRLAVTIVPAAEVERWRQKGHTVKRGCYAVGAEAAQIIVQITGPKGLKNIAVTHTLHGLTAKVGTEDLNGSTPTTVQDLIGLIDRLVE